MIKDIIQKVINKENLNFNEAHITMNKIISGEVNNSQIAAILIALKSKGETAEEVAGFAKAMRDKSIKVDNESDTVDVCGTGGDNSNTINISTAVAFVVAGTGIKVAKHGNRSISSKSGSSDVLTELGVNINLSNEDSKKALEQIGITFLFAPNYHPAMKYVMPVRRELGFKTVFNILGPLTNPAETKKQMIGTFSNGTAKLMREAAQHLDMEKVCFVCTENKYDEITLTGKTSVYEFDKNTGIKDYEISHETFNYPKISISNIKGGMPKENAEKILNLFENKEKNPLYYVVAANAAFALYSSGFSNNLTECKNAAEDSIDSDKALAKLIELRSFN